MVIRVKGKTLMPDYDFGRFAEGTRYNFPEKDYVKLPNGTVNIDMQTFKGKDFIKYLTIPEGVVYIGKGAFVDCKNLKTVDFPSTLKIIDNGAFAGCDSLKKVVIPNNIEKVGIRVFPEKTSIFFQGIEISKWTANYPDNNNRISTIDKLIKFIRTLDFNVSLDYALKYQCLWYLYFNNQEDEDLLKKIKNRFSYMFIQAIKDGDLEIVNWAIENDYITEHSIDKFIITASESRQAEIYVTLLNYKKDKFGFKPRNFFL